MGLRSLYFLLNSVMEMFWCLKYGISFILAFVGVKMMVAEVGIHIPIDVSLAVIGASLSLAVAFSFALGKREDC